MKKNLVVTLLLVLSACSYQADQSANQITAEETAAVETAVAEYIENAQAEADEANPTATLPPTPGPTQTPEPTQVLYPTPVSPADRIFAINDLGSQERGGVTIEIGRVSLGYKSVLDQDFSDNPAFDTIDLVGEIVFVIVNNTDEPINVYPNQGIVLINGEQIDMINYFVTSMGIIGGKVEPGETAIGSVWFGIKRSVIQDINQMTIIITQPFDDERNDLAEEGYRFELDVSNHVFEELPDYLK